MGSSKRKKNHRDRRSRSRSTSPSKRSDRDERYRHRRRSSSSEGSRDRISSGRSRKKSRSRSRSHVRRRSRSHVRRRSRSHDRRRSRSRDRRSRSRDRRRSRSHDRRRSRSRDRRRSRSHDRGRSRSRDRRKRYRSRSHDRRRSRGRSLEKSSPRDDQYSNRDNIVNPKASKESTKSEERDLSKEIAGYDNMTPAERIKAKVKLMVQKSQPEPVYVPSASQLASIESDAFEQATFSSTKAPIGKQQAVPNNGKTGPSSIGYSSSVDASEYAPTIVHLPSDQPGEIEDPVEQGTTEISHSNKDQVLTKAGEEQRKDSWLNKLKMLRQKHVTPN